MGFQNVGRLFLVDRASQPLRDLWDAFASTVAYYESPFVPRETISVEAAYAVPVERLADRVLSMSTSSPERLGDAVPAMRSALSDALAPFAVDGVVEETIEARGGIRARRMSATGAALIRFSRYRAGR
ncbi:MAG: hypothetical protein JO312_02235 [Hyphomicrobiales bacterium]|nr:hypothetical protein [Hyphomicrobiales bacterium]